MTEISKRRGVRAATHPAAPTGWEARATERMLEANRDQLLRRSRQIVDAAYELLDEAGLEGLTIRAVLKRTGLSRRAFYERFADKDELVLAVFEQTIQRAASHYREQIKALRDPLQRLQLILNSIVLTRSAQDGVESTTQGSGRRGAAMSREHLRLAQSRAADLQVALAPLLALIAQQLADGMAMGSVRAGDPQRLATLVYNLVSTTVHTALLAEESARLNRAQQARLASEIWEFCRRAIAA